MRPMIAKMRLKMAMIGPGTSYQPGPAECAERLNPPPALWGSSPRAVSRRVGQAAQVALVCLPTCPCHCLCPPRLVSLGQDPRPRSSPPSLEVPPASRIPPARGTNCALLFRWKTAAKGPWCMHGFTHWRRPQLPELVFAGSCGHRIASIMKRAA